MHRSRGRPLEVPLRNVERRRSPSAARPSGRAHATAGATPAAGGDERFRKLFALTVVAFFSVLFFRMIGPFLEALLLAAVLSGILYPVYRWLLARSVRPTLAAIAVIVLVLIAIVLPLTFVVGAVTREAVRLTEVVGPWLEQQARNDAFAFELPAWLPFRDQLAPYGDDILARLGDAVGTSGAFLVNSASRLTQGTVTALLNLFVMLYAMFFFLLTGPHWLRIFDYTPLSHRDRELILEKGVSITRATIKGTVVIGLLQGTLVGAALAVAGLPAPVFWGFIAAVASVIPFVGAALVWVPAAVLLVARGDVLAGIGVAAWGAAVVSSVDNLVRPRLVGNDTRMPDLLILLSTLGGIGMFGATGIIIGPIVAGFFVSSWHIFATTFKRELEVNDEAPLLRDEEPGEEPGQEAARRQAQRDP
ncbi:MAG TPA: AI-2E family transporter [Gammaproteobacteria bacterium]